MRTELSWGWTEQIRNTGGRDPLGMSHVAFRLADQLLYCITSITPRARYYPFLTWAVGQASAHAEEMDFQDALRLLEKAYVLGAVLHHEGGTCDAGSLVGSGFINNWLESNPVPDTFNLTSLPFAKNLAFGQYVSSLVDLRLIQGVDAEEVGIDTEDEEEALEQSQAVEVSGLSLSESGKALAERFACATSADAVAEAVFSHPELVSVGLLKAWGETACLCGLTDSEAECGALTGLYFNDPPIWTDAEGQTAHETRRASLVYLMHQSDLFAAEGVNMTGRNFLHASVLDALQNTEGRRVPLPVRKQDQDTHLRWRMAALHNNLTLGLETLLSCILSAVEREGDQGVDLWELVIELDSHEVREYWQDQAVGNLPASMTECTLAEFVAAFGLDLGHSIETAGTAWWSGVDLIHSLSESVLQDALDGRQMPGSPVSMSIGLVLVAASILRYARYMDDGYVGSWMQGAVEDEAVDVCPFTMLSRYARQDTRILRLSMGDWLYDMLTKDVLAPHLRVSIRKQGPFLDWPEGERVYGRGRRYDRAAVGSARLPSAIRILKDTGLLDEDGRMTETGRRWSNREGGESS